MVLVKVKIVKLLTILTLLLLLVSYKVITIFAPSIRY